MIDTLGDFLDYAVRLEAEAARGYDLLTSRMEAAGNAEVAALFSQLGKFSRMHLQETSDLYRDRLGREADLDKPLQWPDGHSPESPRPGVADPTNVRAAMLMALSLERHACDFYSMVANQSRDAEVQELAQEFADEEAEHVSHLERWLQRHDQR